ncbi:hypothetical protein SS50377_22616 [Spironucleus salmonicida]|uniref:Uncharacterized protein n=1 Tax=Spironucleus salmonicida TaxID=348837 RepID=A0A9P8RZC7_9EUKA|nr:hypothetical protein SS50377_22616 [Spironucleus salmonicida]
MKGTEQHRCPVRFTSHLSILRAVVGDATETQSQEGSCAASGASVAWVELEYQASAVDVCTQIE